MTTLAGLLYTTNPPSPHETKYLARTMLQACTPRGRDDTGAWAAGPAAMAATMHRTRDLTPDGAQPRLSADQQRAVVFDGYIANAGALRRELEQEGIRLRGAADAELVAEGTGHWGLNRLLQKMDGAYALALWDARDNAIHLVRDRMGLKPMFFARGHNTCAFASDPRALKHLPGFTLRIAPEAAASYLTYGHAPCLYADVTALPAGHRVMLGPDNAAPRPEAYWTAAGQIEEARLRDAEGDAGTRLERLSATLVDEAIALDVPFAALDDGTPASGQLRATLNRASEQPYRSVMIALPDGPTVQTAFDTLARLPTPASLPYLLAWHAALKKAEAPVVLAATLLDRPEDEAAPKRSLLSRLLPRRRADIAGEYAASLRGWALTAPAPEVAEPRLTSPSTAGRRAFWRFADKFTRAALPALDGAASLANTELRLPLADARMLDFGLPALADTDCADVNFWLRGPLRPRMQDLMTVPLFASIGIEDPAPYRTAWQEFLAGDDRHARPLWRLATLLAWTKANA